MSDPFDILTKEEIIQALPNTTFSRLAKRNRELLLQELRGKSAQELDVVLLLAQQRQAARNTRRSEIRARRQEAQEDQQRTRRKRARQEPLPSVAHKQFLQLPTPEELAKCHLDFIEATSNAALAPVTCVVCARESAATDCMTCIIDELPNVTLLTNDEISPHCPRFHNYVVQTDLLVTTPTSQVAGSVCGECRQALVMRKRPKHALANGLWIGEVPLELQNLTHPEELLLGLHFPRIFFYKLRAKDRGAPQDPEKRQRAMVGNIVSFASNIDKVADMLAGNLMPRPPAVLASVLAVSFIGAGRLPKRWLNSTFRVRRERVREALQWLIQHNPLYSGFTMSEANLQALPEDGIPIEIALNLRQSEDTAAAEREAESYVPDDSFEGTYFNS